MPELFVIASELDGTSATKRIEALDAGRAAVEAELLYPYYCFDVRGRLRSLFGDRPAEFRCLVDARTGHAATADRFATERRSVDASVCLVPTQSSELATRQARRYAAHAMGRASKTAANFDLRIEANGIVYRPFFIVVCGDTRLLVDGVTGDLHPLSTRVGAA